MRYWTQKSTNYKAITALKWLHNLVQTEDICPGGAVAWG